MLLYIVTNLRWKNIITRPWPILSHNCPARGGQLCDKRPWKRSMCNSWFCVTSLVAFLTGKWPPIDGLLSKKYSFWDKRLMLFEKKTNGTSKTAFYTSRNSILNCNRHQWCHHLNHVNNNKSLSVKKHSFLLWFSWEYTQYCK